VSKEWQKTIVYADLEHELKTINKYYTKLIKRPFVPIIVIVNFKIPDFRLLVIKGKVELEKPIKD
jgi:hypothetical protein